ncbi:DUF418 domain-containing protein [Terribacillus saccharophilus]|uniref:DUF418 domain-containing protein n=1 Tax=Terribacillus saccharophilus TaxID=361277 RepID=UPI003D27AFA9
MMKSTERIRLLDILRGFAVLGTLGTNIWIFAHLGNLSYITTIDYSGWWQPEDLVRMIVLFLVNGKLLGLLTIMFGVGMELKYQQALRRGRAWTKVYIGTAVFIFIEGFIHYTLVMEYDILMSYGITAMVVMFLINRDNRFIKKVLIVIGSIHTVVILFLLGASLFANVTLGSFEEVVALYQGGTWFEQVQYRLMHFLPLRMEAILIIPMNIFLFLLGVLLMRSGVFAPDDNGKQQRKKLFTLGICVGLPLNMLIFIPGGALDIAVRYLFAPILSIGYIAVISIVVEYGKCKWLWRCFELVGRMSLSCYVMQNVISSILFYGWGLALGGRVDSLSIILIWFLISLVQIAFAYVWLRLFKAGPLESIRLHTVRILMSK